VSLYPTGIVMTMPVGYKLTHTVHKTTHRLLRTTVTTPSAEHHMQQHTTCTPEDGHIDARNM